MSTRLQLLAFVLLVGAMVALLATSEWRGAGGAHTPLRAGHDVAVAAPTAPEATGVEWIVPPRPVRTRPASAKSAAKLPAAVQESAAAVVLESARIAPSERTQVVTAVLDTGSGETTQYVVAEPLPWLDTTVRSDAGIYVGLKRAEPTVRVQARAQFAQVKAVRLGAIASADWPLNGERPGVQSEVFVGVGGWVQW
ncbi:hypothetical protein METUNv1_01772 [Methyloversatilis universalis FAM5]|uniref:Uncharacterized protein n=1 Tax=Methyloversatilis universalis (strain ATCC BAA-1314 / DSM 25237 / JCM 13912 / CCUG 52030 / FAM5) TaxID=1000565 RepID=F5RBX7_METUF|nr:hypothetical protein [Methyloversatilis universalis]EGK71994.1 hypothetical protein METUNv1_01772 [Methyloversatilis universalis FAM5]